MKMKVVILAGGKGSRIRESEASVPKPMIEICGTPVIIHIMNYFSLSGFNEFIVLCGFKGHVIKDYFHNYLELNEDWVFDFKNKTKTMLSKNQTNWKVSVIDSGLETMTGGRLLHLLPHLEKNEEFIMTYGDGLADINLAALTASHAASKKLVTVSAVQPVSRFGELFFQDEKIFKFVEKPTIENHWISGGYFVINEQALKYIKGPETSWEREPLENLLRDNELNSYKHDSFFHPMDTMRDKEFLESLIVDRKAPWIK